MPDQSAAGGNIQPLAYMKSMPLWTAVFALFALGFLIAATLLAINWKAAAENASAFHSAPICTGVSTNACIQEYWVSVVEISSTGGRNSHMTISVQVPGKAIVELIDENHTELFRGISPGTRVLAEVWQNEVVNLFVSDGARMSTQFNPDWRSQDNMFATALSALASPIFGYLAYKAGRSPSARMKRRRR